MVKPAPTLASLTLLASLSTCIVVETECGPIRGFHDIFSGRNIFMGVPYAAPPVADRRWMPPVDLMDADMCWNGTKHAFLPPPLCMQTGATWIGSEDCLYLTISTPLSEYFEPDLKPFPVMVFFHGGDLLNGYSVVPGNIPSKLRRTISVLANYRLNAFGYLSLNELSSRDPRGVSGNYGLLDQISALRWVQRNIKAFGGDPDRVTVYGQSSGGTSVLALLCSPQAKGLFSRALAMSPSSKMNATLKDMDSMHTSQGGFVKMSPCVNASRGIPLLHCLLNLSSTQIANSVPLSWKFKEMFSLPTNITTPNVASLLVVDGVTLPLTFDECVSGKTPENLSEISEKLPGISGKFLEIFENLPHDVPTVIGTLMEEADLTPGVRVPEYSNIGVYLSESLGKWGTNLGHLLTTMPAYRNLPNQQTYDRIVTDIRFMCPNIRFASKLAKRITSKIYFYSVADGASRPFCGVLYAMNDFQYCPKYAFHLWDLMSFAQDRFGLFLWGKYLSDRDKRLGEVLRSGILQFAAKGYIDGWEAFDTRPYPEEETGEANYFSQQDDKNTSTHFGNVNVVRARGVEAVAAFREQECVLYNRLGMANQACIN